MVVGERDDMEVEAGQGPKTGDVLLAAEERDAVASEEAWEFEEDEDNMSLGGEMECVRILLFGFS